MSDLGNLRVESYVFQCSGCSGGCGSKFFYFESGFVQIDEELTSDQGELIATIIFDGIWCGASNTKHPRLDSCGGCSHGVQI